jgi:hypothetical protein
LEPGRGHAAPPGHPGWQGGGIPSIRSFSANPAVDLLATHGHRLLGNYRFDPRTAVAHREDQSEARVLLEATPTAR